jgi:competence protein ComEA
LAFFLAFGSGGDGMVLIDGGAPLDPAGLVAGDGAAVDPTARSGEPELVVEIVGAIDRPGVFRLPHGSRVGDLVAAAGGYGTRVDTDRASRDLNLAATLHDGDQVRVPSRDDREKAGTVMAGGNLGSTGASAPDARGPLDLNRATSPELEALPGIGPVTAGKILSSREEQPFGEVGDLRTRKLVGEKTFEKLKDLVTVR